MIVKQQREDLFLCTQMQLTLHYCCLKSQNNLHTTVSNRALEKKLIPKERNICKGQHPHREYIHKLLSAGIITTHTWTFLFIVCSDYSLWSLVNKSQSILPE